MFGALVFVIFLPLEYAIQFQLLGGIWISQTIPAVIVGLYTAWFNPWALIIGWAAGLATGTLMAASTGFQSAVFPLALDGLTVPGYAALYALGINFGVSIALTPCSIWCHRAAARTRRFLRTIISIPRGPNLRGTSRRPRWWSEWPANSGALRHIQGFEISCKRLANRLHRLRVSSRLSALKT